MFTKDEIIAMIRLYIEAEKSVLTGKSYKIGTRELYREDLAEIIAGRKQWELRLNALNNKSGRSIKRIIPTDL